LERSPELHEPGRDAFGQPGHHVGGDHSVRGAADHHDDLHDDHSPAGARERGDHVDHVTHHHHHHHKIFCPRIQTHHDDVGRTAHNDHCTAVDNLSITVDDLSDRQRRLGRLPLR
jgi:hypothetical protein